jgi:hypothetical protein
LFCLLLFSSFFVLALDFFVSSFSYFSRMNSSLRQEFFGCPICLEEDALIKAGSLMVPCKLLHEFCTECCKGLWGRGAMARCPLCNIPDQVYSIHQLLKTSLKKRQLYEALFPARPSLDLNETTKIEVHTPNMSIKVETSTSHPTPPSAYHSSTSIPSSEDEWVDAPSPFAPPSSTRTTPCSDCLTFRDTVLAAGGNPSEIADGLVCCASLLRSTHSAASALDSEEGFALPNPSSGRPTVYGRRRTSFCPYENACYPCRQYAIALPFRHSTSNQIFRGCDWRPFRNAPY